MSVQQKKPLFLHGQPSMGLPFEKELVVDLFAGGGGASTGIDYSGKRIFTHDTVWGGKWRGFTHGGTLRDLVKEFRDYICTGEPLHPGYLGPERFNDSNIWGYDEADMQSVREQAGALPVFRQPDVEAA